MAEFDETTDTGSDVSTNPETSGESDFGDGDGVNEFNDTNVSETDEQSQEQLDVPEEESEVSEEDSEEYTNEFEDEPDETLEGEPETENSHPEDENVDESSYSGDLDGDYEPSVEDTAENSEEDNDYENKSFDEDSDEAEDPIDDNDDTSDFQDDEVDNGFDDAEGEQEDDVNEDVENDNIDDSEYASDFDEPTETDDDVEDTDDETEETTETDDDVEDTDDETEETTEADDDVEDIDDETEETTETDDDVEDTDDETEETTEADDDVEDIDDETEETTETDDDVEDADNEIEEATEADNDVEDTDNETDEPIETDDDVEDTDNETEEATETDDDVEDADNEENKPEESLENQQDREGENIELSENESRVENENITNNEVKGDSTDGRDSKNDFDERTEVFKDNDLPTESNSSNEIGQNPKNQDGLNGTDNVERKLDSNENPTNNKNDFDDEYKSEVEPSKNAEKNFDNLSEQEKAFEDLKNYMTEHDYGQEDFNTYYHDPAWQELHSKAFPDSNFKYYYSDQEMAQRDLANYVSEHNYGMGDFDTYRMDPEWQQLHTKAFPDSDVDYYYNDQELAKIELNNYMSEHDYLEGDFDTYSQDPTWQDIHSRAFPEYENTEPLGKIDGLNYSQGQNDIGAKGTCGPTSIANGLTRLTGREYTENDVLHTALDKNLCDNPADDVYNIGGTTTKQLTSLIGEVTTPEDGIQVDVKEYGNAPSVEDLADKLKDNNCIAIVGVESSVLWDEPMGQSLIGGVYETSTPSDHWIMVDSPVYDEQGALKGFNIVDSGGGKSYANVDEFRAAYSGAGNYEVADPTAVYVSKSDAPSSTTSEYSGRANGSGAGNFEKNAANPTRGPDDVENKTYSLSDIGGLERTENFRYSALEHIFSGDDSRSTGYHYEGLTDSAGRVVGERTEPDQFGIYEANVEFDSGSKRGNDGTSSFFPESKAPQEIVDDINYAYDNKERVGEIGNTYEGTAEDGTKIRMFIDNSGKIISAFPVYKSEE